MHIGIETLFRREERNNLCSEIVAGKEVLKKCRKFLLLTLCSAAFYGFTMGLGHSVAQAFASAIKVFLLFMLTLVVCVPTLHFTGLLLGSRILFAQTLCVLLAGIALTCTFLGAFAPISAFFLFSGSSYEFLLLLHVGIFACCGTVGLISVKQNMVGISWLLCNRSPQDDSEADWKNVANFPDVGMEHAQHRTSKLLMLWFLLYMFIGSQTAFLLSPFVGREQQFMLFASDKGDFFSYVLKTFGDLLR